LPSSKPPKYLDRLEANAITDLYNRHYDEPNCKLCPLHRGLDAQVFKAYGWSTEEDLLDLNLVLAKRAEVWSAAVGHWDPYIRV
jgi:hypothetical protein